MIRFSNAYFPKRTFAVRTGGCERVNFIRLAHQGSIVKLSRAVCFRYDAFFLE